VAALFPLPLRLPPGEARLRLPPPAHRVRTSQPARTSSPLTAALCEPRFEPVESLSNFTQLAQDIGIRRFDFLGCLGHVLKLRSEEPLRNRACQYGDEPDTDNEDAKGDDPASRGCRRAAVTDRRHCRDGPPHAVPR